MEKGAVFLGEGDFEGEKKDKKKSARSLGRCCYFLWYMMFDFI